MKQAVWPLRTFCFLFALVVLLAAAPAAHGQSLSPNLLSFPNTAVTNNSAAKPLTLTNSGTAAMSVSVSMIGGDFDQTNTCGTSLASKKSCTINVVFNPTGTGVRAAILNVRAGTGIQLALLTGTAIPQVTLSATTMTFASQVIGASSAAQAVSMKNNQNIAMPVTGVTITGDYTQTNNCGSSLAAGATCSLSVIFKPTAAGTRTGLLSVKDNAVSNPEDITLSGTATAATVKSIAVTPATASIVKGKTQQFTAIVTYTNNATADVTATATWTSSSAAIATVSKGLTTGVAVGSATMTASVTGSTITGKSTLTVTAPTLVSIAVSPNAVSVVKGKTQQFTATGTYSDGSTAALSTATWSSTTGATITTTGLATASAVGAPVIKATSGTISGTSTMTVTPATLVSIAVTPATVTIAKGKTQQFTATGTYSDGTTAAVTATWTSATGASITSTGLATGTAVGAPIITVTSGAISGKATLTVQAAALVSIAVTPATAAIPKGKTQQFTATGTYTDGTTAAVTTTWTSATGASITSAGLATGTAVGAPVITATSGIISGTAVLTVQPAALVSIAVTPANASIAKGRTQQYSATGTYTDNTTQVLSGLTWTSGTGASITSTGLATGTAVGAQAITATSGTIGGSTTLNVQAAALVSLSVTPATATINKGLTQQYAATGTYTDATTAAVAVTWSSTANASVATTGLATGTAVGNSTITASSGTIVGSAALTVNPAALVSIAVTPANSSVAKGLAQQFTATGTYTDATTQNLTGTVVWSSTAEASIVPSGLATGTTVGIPTITATSGSVSGATFLTVQPAALVSIAVSPSAASIGRGSNQQFTALGTYTDASTQDISSTVAWSASAGATIVPGGVATATVIGNSTVTATLSSINGSAALSVVPPALTAITVTPGSVSLGLHGQQQFTAIGTFADSTTQDISNTVVWTSGNNSLLSVSTIGVAKVLGTSSSATSVTANSSGIISNSAWLSAIAELPPVCSSPTIDMKLLIVTNGKSEADFPAIKQALDYLGTPYDVYDLTTPSNAGITKTMLSDGNCHGYYQGIIFTYSSWMYILPGPGNADLIAYEQTYKVRQLNWYVFPGQDFGFNPYNNVLDSSQTYTANFTPAAEQVFPNVNTSTPLNFSNAAIVLAGANDGSMYPIPAGATVTPLLTDNLGNALSLIYAPGDGREYLSQTFDSNQYLMHDLITSYGLINWVTRGVFLGEYHVYAIPQVDDVFINDHEWAGTTPCHPTDGSTDRTDSDADTLGTVRMVGTDVDSLLAWQQQKQQNPLLSNFVLHMAFNGVGTTGNVDLGGYNPDTLTPEFLKYQADFKWISHTYDHPDTLNGQTAQFIDDEILKNNQQAQILGLTNYSPANMVTPGVTGLNDATYVNRAVADGVKYVVTDTSVLNTPNNGPNPSPNVGLVNTINSSLYLIPRHANNLYFNVATPDGWTAEYQCIYSGTQYGSYNYQNILDNISQSFVANMAKGDMDPQMFHQPNLVAYDGTHSLIGDLYDNTFNLYLSMFKLPVLSPTQDQVGMAMQQRNNYNVSGVTASIVNAGSVDASVSITVPAGTVTSAIIPVTGLSSNGSEVYGGTSISHIPVNAGDTVALPMQ